MWNLLVFSLGIFFSINLATGHVETSDLEETDSLKLDIKSFFKKKPSTKVDETVSAQYSYDGGPGTSEWDGACASGYSQSPIAFETDNAVPVLRRILRFSGLEQIPLSTNITNSGHSVKVKLRTPAPITVTGGVLKDTVYVFQQLHFHWGKGTTKGSEHMIGDKSFSLESHFVFYKANSPDPTAEEDGIVVLASVYELSPKDNRVLETVTKTARIVRRPGSFMVRPGGFPLASYLPSDLDNYFNYKGSLTTPPCTEGVTWIWFPEKQTVSNQQLEEFQLIRDEKGLEVLFNHRETQPLNSRTVYFVKASPRIVM